MSIKSSFYCLVCLIVISTTIYLFSDEMTVIQIKDIKTFDRNRVSLIERRSPKLEFLNQSAITRQECNNKSMNSNGTLYINETEEKRAMIKEMNPVREITVRSCWLIKIA